MILGLALSTIVELILAGLLAATLFYCMKLERGLRLLRKDQDKLSATVDALNSGIAAAQASLAGLRAAAKDAGENLVNKVAGARALADELALLASSSERIASRMESAIERPPRALRPNAPVLGDALRSMR